MPNVLLLFEYPSLNGGERSILATLDRVRQAGYRIQAIAPPEGSLAAELRRHEVPVQGLSCHWGNTTRLSLEETRRELATMLRRTKPQLLHANSLSMARLSGPVAATLGIPSIGHIRDIVGLSSQAIADLNCHTRLLAVSEAARSFHIAAGVSSSITMVALNGIDLKQFRPRNPSYYLQRELGLPEQTPLVAAIGQIGPRKGMDVLLRAAEQLAVNHGDIHILIVGQRYSAKVESIRYEEFLQRSASSDGLRGRVHFLGVRSDIERLLPELTLFVHPARQEPLGRTIIEAAASGVATVATDVGGTSEILGHDGLAGRLVPPDDAAALAHSISGLLSDAEERRQLGNAARRLAVERFSDVQAAEYLLRHYRDVLRGRTTHRPSSSSSENLSTT